MIRIHMPNGATIISVARYKGNGCNVWFVAIGSREFTIISDRAQPSRLTGKWAW